MSHEPERLPDDCLPVAALAAAGVEPTDGWEAGGPRPAPAAGPVGPLPPPGYHWMRCSPAGDWQVVRVLDKLCEPGGGRQPRVLFCGDRWCPTAAELAADHPDAEWGERIPAPGGK